MELFHAFGRLVLEGQEMVEQGLRRAESAGQGFADNLDKLSSKLDSSGKAMTKWVTGPLAGVAVAFTGVAFSAAKAGDEIAKSARASGVSVQAYQEVEFALSRLAGMSRSETDRALRDLNRTISEAAEGSEDAANMLASFGFSLEDVSSGAVSTEDVLDGAIRAIENAGSAAEANAISMEVFGRRAGIQLAQAVREGGEAMEDARAVFANEIGGMSKEQTDMAEKFTDDWDVMTRQLGMFKNEIGVAVMPAILGLVTVFQDHFLPAITSAAESFSTFVDWFTQLPGPVQATAVGIVGIVAALGPLLILAGALLKPFASIIRLMAGMAVGKGLLVAAAAPLLLVFAKIAAGIALGVAAFFAIRKAIEVLPGVFTALMSGLTRAYTFVTGLWSRLIKGAADAGQGFRDGIKAGVDAVIGFFRNLPNAVLQFVTRMVSAVISRISSMASRIRSILSSLRRAVVGNSIIPDMADQVVNVMGKMADDSVRKAADMKQGVENALPDASLATARAGGAGASRRGAGGAGGAYIDMRHAVIRDDRDMLSRMRMQGAELSGAFG